MIGQDEVGSGVGRDHTKKSITLAVEQREVEVTEFL